MRVRWGNTAALVDRGVEFDGINVGGSLTFSGATTLNLAFNNSGSLVNWNDPFWSTDKTGKLRDAATGGHAVGGHAARRDATGDCCDSCDQPRSHDTSRR